MNAKPQQEEIDPIPHYDWEDHTNLTVGEILQKAREHYGLGLNDVETALRIRASQLQALEQGNVDKLPGRVYAIGFVRAYAEYLRLDGDKMVHLFKRQSVGAGHRPELHIPVEASESKAPNLYILGGSLVGLIIIFAGLAFFGNRSVSDTEILAPEKTVEASVVAMPMVTFEQAPLEQSLYKVIEPAADLYKQSPQENFDKTQIIDNGTDTVEGKTENINDE